MAEITDEEMNQQMDLHEADDCYVQALDDQMNKGVIKEKLYCQICHALCALSAFVDTLDN